MAEAKTSGIYACEQCDRSFSVQSNLRRHIRTVHSDNRPYLCQVCGKTFNQNCNLKRHLRIHSVEERNLAGVQLEVELNDAPNTESVEDESDNFIPTDENPALNSTELLSTMNMFDNASAAILFGDGGEPSHTHRRRNTTGELVDATVDGEDQLIIEDVFIEVLPSVAANGKYGIHNGAVQLSASGKLLLGSGKFIGINPSSSFEPSDMISNSDVLFNPVVRVSGDLNALSGSSQTNENMAAMRLSTDSIPLFTANGSPDVHIFNNSAQFGGSGSSLNLGNEVGTMNGSGNYIDAFTQGPWSSNVPTPQPQ